MPEARPDRSAPFIWRSLAARLILIAIPLALTITVLVFNVGPAIRLVAAAALVVSFVSPVHGLLLVATFAPIGRLVATAIGAGEFRMGEIIVLAFFVGWLLRARQDRPGPRMPAATAGWLFAATVVGSIAGLALRLRAFPGALTVQVDQIVHGFFFSIDPIGFADGMRLLEGLGLAAAAVLLLRHRPALSLTLPAALTSSAAIAACSSLLLWRGIGPAAALERFGRDGYRVSAHVLDVNAAGSYFAMILCLAIGMAARYRGYRRGVWCVLSVACVIGVWLAESRSAMAAAAIVLATALTWAFSSRYPVRTRAATLLAVAIVALAAGAVRARLLEHDPTYRGAGFREQFFATSVRMIAARPVFGVGEGQYYGSSSLFLSPQLAWTYGAENAHNVFLQIGSELGLVGFGLFVWWVGATIVRTSRALARAQRDWRLLGCASGVMAFLGTCLTGHPLLVGEVAYPFWILLGLTAALAGSVLLNDPVVAERPALRRQTTRAWLGPVAAGVILIASPIASVRSAVAPADSQSVDGFYGWETLEDGTRFRWTNRYASVFVPGDVTRVEIPIRVPADGRSVRPIGVEVMMAGQDRGRVLAGGTWAIVSLPLGDAVPRGRFKRIDLKVDRVWQPALYIAGSADMRMVGVQVGEPRLVRE